MRKIKLIRWFTCAFLTVLMTGSSFSVLAAEDSAPAGDVVPDSAVVLTAEADADSAGKASAAQENLNPEISNVDISDEDISDALLAPHIPDSGYFQTDESGKHYYTDTDELVTGQWIFYDDKDYYADEAGVIICGQMYSLGGKTYCFDQDGVLQYGVFSFDGSLCYSNAKGQVRTDAGWQEFDGKWYYIAADGFIRTNGIVATRTKLYRVGADGTLEEGIFPHNDKLYYFDSNGESVLTPETWLDYKGDWYYIGKDGYLLQDSLVESGKNLYYLGNDGKMATGFLNVDGKLRYADKNGKIRTAAGWFKVGDEWYYNTTAGYVGTDMVVNSAGKTYHVGAEGKLTGGVYPHNGRLYLFDSRGEAVLTPNTWVMDGSDWYYISESGSLLQNGAAPSGKNLYYMGEDGKLTQGFVTVDGKLRYADENGKIRKAAGWFKVGDDWYYNTTAGYIGTDMVVNSSGKTYYVGEDGKLTGGVHPYNGKLYYFDSTGTAVVTPNTWVKDGEDWYYISASGNLLQNGAAASGSKMYYLGADGKLSDGVITVDGKLRYVDTNGKYRTDEGWVSAGGGLYYLTSNGYVAADQVISSYGRLYYAGADGKLTGGVHAYNDKLYYFDSNGSVVYTPNTWVQDGGNWYFIGASGYVPQNALVEREGELYYLDEDGKTAGGLANADGKLYYAEKSGKIKTTEGWIRVDGVLYYITAEGNVAAGQVINANGSLYYAGEDGRLTGGMADYGRTTILFGQDGSPYRQEGWTAYNGKNYYLNSDGTVRKNDIVGVGALRYYVGSDGTPEGGFHTVGGVTRYFDVSGKIRPEGWLQIGSNLYYIDSDGVPYADGIKYIGSNHYYFDKNGVMQTGMISLGNGKFCYAGKGGVVFTSCNFDYQGITYYADQDGIVYVGTMYKKAQGYSSNTDYLILVNLTTQKTAVFKGSKGKWLLQKEFSCSTGNKDNPTPVGEYNTTIHDLYFDSYGLRCWYATGFIGGLYLFHSSPYRMDSSPKVCADSTMGRPSSHGCIRLRLEDAKWMYDTLPLRTKVVIYKD